MRKQLTLAPLLLILGLALMVPGGALGSPNAGSADMSTAKAQISKKKCKKKKKKCKKATWAEGSYSGTYAESNADLFFNVRGGRIYTGPLDRFFIDAICSDGSRDGSAIEPVQAFIAPNGTFAGSGVYMPGLQMPWKLSGRIAGRSITGGIFTVGPYNDFFGNVCSGTTHFTAQWFSSHTL